jgi:hypothetical protein
MALSKCPLRNTPFSISLRSERLALDRIWDFAFWPVYMLAATELISRVSVNEWPL